MTHLNLFLAQLQNDGIEYNLKHLSSWFVYVYFTGYSIFVVVGDLPVSEADRKMTSALKTGFDGPGYKLGDSDMNFDTQLALAISASLNEGMPFLDYIDIFDGVFILPLNQKGTKVLEGKLSNNLLLSHSICWNERLKSICFHVSVRLSICL